MSLLRDAAQAAFAVFAGDKGAPGHSNATQRSFERVFRAWRFSLDL